MSTDKGNNERGDGDSVELGFLKRKSSEERRDGQKSKAEQPTVVEQAFSCIFYALSSVLVIFVNKVVLSTFQFPSFGFIAMSQFVATFLVTTIARITGRVKIVKLNKESTSAILPIMVIFVLNTVCGLGGTKFLSLPMFTVLRRFSILMTMVMEHRILGVSPSRMVQFSILLMIGGAFVAALFDLSFNLRGYLLLLGNDFFTAAYGVYMKKAFNLSIPQSSLLYFNSIFGSLCMMVVLMFIPEEVEKIVSFEGWSNYVFVGMYLVTSFMGSILQYSIFLCTRVNSALTTSVVGCLKNVATTMLGMMGVGGQYNFDPLNFAALSISMIGSFVYSWAKISKR